MNLVFKNSNNVKATGKFGSTAEFPSSAGNAFKLSGSGVANN